MWIGSRLQNFSDMYAAAGRILNVLSNQYTRPNRSECVTSMVGVQVVDQALATLVKKTGLKVQDSMASKQWLNPVPRGCGHRYHAKQMGTLFLSRRAFRKEV